MKKAQNAGAVAVLVFVCAGCQTFNMPEERFKREQAGQYDETTAAQGVEIAGWLLQFFGPWLSCY